MQRRPHPGRAVPQADGTFGAPKSEKSERSVTISRTLVEILRQRIEGSGQATWSSRRPREVLGTPTTFATATGAPPSPRPADAPSIRRPWSSAAEAGSQEKIDPLSVSTCACKTRLHQKPRIHDTRHSHVGWLIDAGWDLYAIQQRIGHESIKTTFDVYGHRLSHGDTDKLDALDTMLDRRQTKKRGHRTSTEDQRGDGLHNAA